jgi:ornithine cyclodeaminase/alanine dehydrogenase-like protein (mu-crystallin family)
MAERCGRRVFAVDSAEAAVQGADVVDAATNSLDPVIRADYMRDGVHLCTVTVNEVDQETVQEADRVAFHTRAFTKEHTFRPAAAPPIPQQRPGWWSVPDAPYWSEICDLADLAVGRARGRERDDEVTVFVNNIGMGLQFAAVGSVVYEAARARGLGRELPTEWFTQTVHP